MNAEYIISQLDKSRSLFRELLEVHDHHFITYRPSEQKWCLLEIVCHLADEEREDFRNRVDSALHRSHEEWPSIDPAGWVTQRNYMGQDYFEKVSEFLHEREKSVHWLKSLNEPVWDSFYDHPKLGRMTAYYLLNNWLAHDYLHIKQIIKLRFDYLRDICGLDSNYAGEWK